MYIESVPNHSSPPAILLRESYREHGKVKKRTLANLSKWPAHLVEGLRVLLKGGFAVASFSDAFDILRSQPHGHVAAVRAFAAKIGLDRLLGRRSRLRDLALALILSRVLAPASKLATARGLHPDTLRNSLADVLALDAVNENDLYAAMDWLRERQDAIEQRLASQHLAEGSLVLCDLTSSYMEGRCCPLAKRGYSRDGKRNTLQIEFGLLCNRDGCPVAVEVFPGNTADPRTVGVQIRKLQRRFGLSRVVLVGDRGMLTEARIHQEVQPAGLDWISALRAPAIRELVESGAVQTSLFDERDLIEIRADAYPGERLMVCRTIRCWPPNAHASARSCWRPPNGFLPRSWQPPPAPRVVSPAPTRSPCGSARSSTSTRWPSTSTSTSATLRSATGATRRRSRPRLPSTACTSCAPAWPTTNWMPRRRCAPTRG